MVKAYLEITLTINEEDRKAVTGIYKYYKVPFLESIQGALSKEMLVHVEEVQLLHGFDSVSDAQVYLLSDLFTTEVVFALKPYLKSNSDIKVYKVV